MTETQIETAQPAPTPAVELKPSRHQLRIAKLQQQSRDARSGKEPAEPKPLTYVNQLEKTVANLLLAAKSEGVQLMIEPMKAALEHLASIVTTPDSATPQDKLRASQTIAWLSGVALKTSVRLSRFDVQKAIANKSAANAAARKAKHSALQSGHVIEIAKARKRMDRTLRKAAEEQARATELARLEQEVVATRGDSLNHLLAKQALMKFKQKGSK